MNDKDHVLEVERLCVDYQDTPLFGKKTTVGIRERLEVVF